MYFEFPNIAKPRTVTIYFEKTTESIAKRKFNNAKKSNMGLFSNLMSDFSEIGSNKSKFKKKFTDLFSLLTDYSFGELPYSSQLGRQKIIVAYNELIEFSQTVNQNEIIKIYFRDEAIDFSITVAIKSADTWVNDILEKNVQLTNSYAKRIIDLEKNNAKLKTTNSFSSNKLTEIFPNFKKAVAELSNAVKELQLESNSSQLLQFKFPILTYGRTMGYNFLGIQKRNTDYELFFYTKSQISKRRIDATSKYISSDLNEEVYFEILSRMMREVFSNSTYIDITVNG